MLMVRPLVGGEIGVERDNLAPVAHAAVKDHSFATNRRACTQADYLALLEVAL